MSAPCRARRARCASAWVLSICVAASPALADRTQRSLAACTRFEQVDKGDDGVAFTIRSTCSMPVDCALSWRVVCAPDSKKRRALHHGAAKFTITDGRSESAEASAAVCGDDAWAIDSVRWSCQPNKD